MPPLAPSSIKLSHFFSSFGNLHISSPSRLSSLRTSLLKTPRTPTSILPRTCLPKSTRPFSTSTPSMAGGGSSSKSKRHKGDTRVALIRYHLQHPKTPRPLRFSRMRALRHWTIHRAWMLVRRKKGEAEEKELYRMYQSMHAACEELRLLDPPGTKDAGRLYRIAMEKKGIFGKDGVPIEYARYQTDTPATEAWNHAWTR